VNDRYRPFPKIELENRRWPSRSIQRAPRWCSVDLRDGNQALVEPMDSARKRAFFDLLVRMGFREIEIGFPAASQTDFDFVRELIDEGAIPADVTIAVLTQARADLIDRTFVAIDGAPRAIVHVYNATSPLFRRVVFGLDEDGVVAIATEAVARIKQRANEISARTRVQLEYSPETFSATELPFAKRISEAVFDVWQPTVEEPLILNLPATVEMASPNIYADQIEWMDRNLRGRDRIVLSVHPHNDRGTAVAAAELGLMAGADRVEGTLFGNGERTGNVDLITLALNLLSQGVDPGIDCSDLPEVVRITEDCTRMTLHPRHPYAGELVFTAFSGSHQDAIKKGFAAQRAGEIEGWGVPYLGIDPKDIGRSYEAVVRVNSQSGKGGVAYLLEATYGFTLPRALQIAFARVIQADTEASGGEMTAAEILAAFEETYVRPRRYRLADYRSAHTTVEGAPCTFEGTLRDGEAYLPVFGTGTGPIDAFVDSIRRTLGVDIAVHDYHEHALGSGQDARAVAYVQITSGSESAWGVGIDRDIVTASLSAITGALGRIEPVALPALSTEDTLPHVVTLAVR
jgi:2-isopropylmalate synthase